MAAERVSSGPASIVFDQSAVIAHIDRVSSGAASSFIKRATQAQDPIAADAVAQWPVGQDQNKPRSRDLFARRTRITPDALAVDLTNTASPRRGKRGLYPFGIRWSVRTKAGIQAEIAALTPESQSVQNYWKAARAKGQVKKRKPGQKSKYTLRQWWGAKLKKRHGQGAPSAELAGKQPWRVLVIVPGTRAGKALVEQVRADLAALAKGA